MDRVRFIRNTTLFARVPASVIARVTTQLTERRLKAGDVLFDEGDPGSAAYFVVRGSIGLKSKNVRVASAEEGDCFGEFALIDDAARSATAFADSSVVLLEWTRKDFLDAVGRSKTLATSMFRALTHKLREDVQYQVKTDRDLERARRVQMAMMPTSDSSEGAVHIAGVCKPALAVGGDYYDYFSLSDGKVAIVIADVLGHGFDAGLLVAMIKSCVFTQVRVDAAPSSVMAALNRIISRSPETVLLTTCCYLVIDPKAGRLSFTNAGHVNPYLYRSRRRRLSRLETTDRILGFPGGDTESFQTREKDWEADDMLLLFTDGISEAEDVRGKDFGEPRLGRVLMEGKHETPAAIRERLLADLSVHGDGVEQADDETFVVARGMPIARHTRHR